MRLRLRFLLIANVLMGCLVLHGAAYFVSPSGNNSWPGTVTQPFASLQYAVDRLSAGDTLYVRGGIYHEAVTVHQSGTSAAPITIQAYSGECPVLVGPTVVSSTWSLHRGAIYKTSWPTQPEQVFADGRLLVEARWPNTRIEDFSNMTYALTEAGTQDFISSSALPDLDLTGAWVHVMSGQSWVAYSRRVTAHDRAAGRLTFSDPVNALTELIPRRGNHFYLFGKLELLDAPGEWWWDQAGQMLYVWMPDSAPPAERVEAGTASAVLNLSGREHVVVSGLSARGGWFNLQNSVSCTVRDCHLRAPNWARVVNGYALWPQYLGGIDVSGTGNLIEGGSVRLAGRSGVRVGGTGNTVRQVTVEDSGWNWSNGAGIHVSESDQSVIENNTVRRTTLAGIVLGPRARIRYNLVENVCLYVEDCGNLNAWDMDGKGTEVAYNVLRTNRTRWGAGIYLDAGSLNFNLHDNLAENIEWSGANITGPTTIVSNTFADVQHQGVTYGPTKATDLDWSAVPVAHNQMGQPFPFTVTLNQPASLIPNYAHYFTYTTLLPGPRRVEVLWSQLGQPAWSAEQVAMNLSAVDSISFGLDAPALPFHYEVGNLRLLPAGGSGDEGAVPLGDATWSSRCTDGATCTITITGMATWGLSGSIPYGGVAALTAGLPSGLRNLSPYRGLAFELSGAASRTYTYKGSLELDNGPERSAGRGASLPDHIGAEPSGAWPVCASTKTTVSKNGVVNAASFQSALAPGCLAAVFGSGLADAEYANLFHAAQKGFPTSYAGVTVSVNGSPAPLTYVSPTQINFQVPWGTKTPATVLVTREGAASNGEAVTLGAAAPSAFAAGGTAIVSCSGANCTLWGNGLGVKKAVMHDGEPAGSKPFLLADLETLNTCSLTIGGQIAQVTYCGAGPGQIIDQINFVYPGGVTGPADATLTIGTVSGTFRMPAPAR